MDEKSKPKFLLKKGLDFVVASEDNSLSSPDGEILNLNESDEVIKIQELEFKEVKNIVDDFPCGNSILIRALLYASERKYDFIVAGESMNVRKYDSGLLNELVPVVFFSKR